MKFSSNSLIGGNRLLNQASSGVEGVLSVIALLAAIGFFMNGVTGGAVQSAIFPGGDVGVDGVYSGPIAPRMSHVDAINSGTQYNEGASATTRWIRNTGAVGVPQTGYQLLTTGNNTFSALREDRGIVFAEVEGNVGDTLYLDIRRTLDSNPGLLEAYGYVDYDNDAKKEHMFRVNFAGIGLSAGQTTLDLPLNVVWYAKADSFSGAVQEPSASLVNVGNSQNNTQVFRYRFSMGAFDQAALIREMHIRYNTSDTNQYVIDKVIVPFYDSRTGTYTNYEFNQLNADETVLATNSTYKWFFAGDRSGIKDAGTVLASKTGAQKYVDILVYTTFTLNENAKLRQAVELRYWDDDEIEQRVQAEIQINDEGPLA